jgi:uracil-DNA glycosylase
MDANHIRELRANVHPEWLSIIFSEEHIMKFIVPLHSISLSNPDTICPRYEDILRAFGMFPVGQLKVVLIGQDPYPNREYASGLSFSTRNGSVSASLRNISCAVSNSCPGQTLTSGNLEHWAQQGVLMLNQQLTIKHTFVPIPEVGNKTTSTVWDIFIDFIIDWINDNIRDIVFVCWGNNAIKCISRIAAGGDTLSGKTTTNNLILQWRHPSPMANTHCPLAQHFKSCDHFRRINEYLITVNKTPIHWGHMIPAQQLQQDPQQTIQQSIQQLYLRPIDLALANPDHTIIFTDGSALGNGKKTCIAAYGYIIAQGPLKGHSDGALIHTQHFIHPVNKSISVYFPSNIRAEMLAIIIAITHILDYKYHNRNSSLKTVYIITDSEFTINVYDNWIDKWTINNKLDDKANLDLLFMIIDQKQLLLQFGITVIFIHTRGHRHEPADKGSPEHYIWQGNDCVDRLCTRITAKANTRPGSSKIIVDEEPQPPKPTSTPFIDRTSTIVIS